MARAGLTSIKFIVSNGDFDNDKGLLLMGEWYSSRVKRRKFTRFFLKTFPIITTIIKFLGSSNPRMRTICGESVWMSK